MLAVSCVLAALFAMPTRSLGEALDVLVVTATRIAEPADQIPADLSVVSGREIAARGAADMATVLSLVPGVEAPPGGDSGPSSAVPSFWGLHEFDAFLLVVDGVPWGGAFNPAITTLDFTGAEASRGVEGRSAGDVRRNLLVGVVHVIHYPAGEAADEADLAYGTYGSVRGSASVVLPQIGAYRQSLIIDGQHLGFADPREAVTNEHALYRGAMQVGAGTLSVDADITFLRDAPPSPVLRAGTSLSALTPVNANFNPADAAINENKYHLTSSYSLPMSWGTWDTLASFA